MKDALTINLMLFLILINISIQGWKIISVLEKIKDKLDNHK